MVVLESQISFSPPSPASDLNVAPLQFSKTHRSVVVDPSSSFSLSDAAASLSVFNKQQQALPLPPLPPAYRQYSTANIHVTETTFPLSS